MRNRLSVILTALVLALCLCACSGNAPEPAVTAVPDVPASDAPASDADVLADAPENYGYAVKVTVNPEYVLYIDGHNHEVIGYSALNDDARSLEGRAMLLDRNVRDALRDIIVFSVDEGFLKDQGEVRLEVLRTSEDQEAVREILQEMEDAVRNAAADRSVSVTPVTAVSPEITYHEREPGPEPGEGPEKDGPGPEPGENEPPQEPGENEPGSEPGGNEPGSEPGGDDEPGEDEPGEDGREPGPGQDEPGTERDENEGCPVCQGSGECDLCEGTGEYECLRCHATGKENGETCPDCDGDGIAPCPACQGTGVCAACGGSGLNPQTRP